MSSGFAAAAPSSSRAAAFRACPLAKSGFSRMHSSASASAALALPSFRYAAARLLRYTCADPPSGLRRMHVE